MRAPDWLAMLRANASPHQSRAPAAATSPGASVHGACCWQLSSAVATSLPREACVALYELVLSGSAALEGAGGNGRGRGSTGGGSAVPVLRPKALLAAADTLGLRALLLAPPCHPTGRPWLELHLAAVPGGLVPVADVRFALADGALLAHRVLLAAGSDYFRTSLAFHANFGGGGNSGNISGGDDDGSGSQPASPLVVRVSDASVAPFMAMLRFVYAGTVELPVATPPSPIPAPPPVTDPAHASPSVAEGSGGASSGGGLSSQVEAQGLALWQRLGDEANVAQDWMHARLQHCLSTAADADADASPATTTPAAAANGGATRASVATPRPVHADAGAPPDGRLGAAGALELALLGDRYLLDGLSPHAPACKCSPRRRVSPQVHARWAKSARAPATARRPHCRRGRAAAPACARGVLECCGADYLWLGGGALRAGACSPRRVALACKCSPRRCVHPQVHALLDGWLTCAPSARPHVPRLLGDKALLALSTNLRTEMLRVRHGL